MNTKYLPHTLFFILLMLVVLTACEPGNGTPVSTASSPLLDDSLSESSIPNFDHIVVITFENKEYKKVIGNLFMPTYNKYARSYTLLTQFYAVTHPSLPNYIAMIGGDTFGITENCNTCFIDAPSLPDLIEASGRTWKTYQEDMEDPCGLGNQDEDEYVQRHNPFVYFDPIRLDHERCTQNVVPIEEFQKDLEAGTLPNYTFITPNICNSAHDCNLYVTDAWLRGTLDQLIPALEKEGPNYLVVLNWDESRDTDNGACCGLPEAGGRIAVVLISPLVKDHFKDATPYTHYSLLKTISKAWDLPYLGHAADDDNALITAPWK